MNYHLTNVSKQGMFPYAALTAGNIIAFVSALIAAGLYGNIGIKTMYSNIFQELLGLPALTTRVGKLLWAAIVPVYWGIAFVLAAAIPQFRQVSYHQYRNFPLTFYQCSFWSRSRVVHFTVYLHISASPHAGRTDPT